jgi:hypothetical protein
LIKRNEFATLVGASTFGYGGKVRWFWLFFKLRYQSPRGVVLHGTRQLAQAIDGFFKQFGHVNKYIKMPQKLHGRE